jgi:hypothetical protein
MLQKANIEAALASLHTSRAPAMLQVLSYAERVSQSCKGPGLLQQQTRQCRQQTRLSLWTVGQTKHAFDAAPHGDCNCSVMQRL